MIGLVLKFGLGECVLVNGVVVENGDKCLKLFILILNVNILRLCDVICLNEVNMFVCCVCYIVQFVLFGDVEEIEVCFQIFLGIE